MIKFTEQYPNMERFESVNGRLARQKRERKEAEAKARKQRREDRKEAIGMAILLPLFFIMAYFGIWILWAITPPHYW